MGFSDEQIRDMLELKEDLAEKIIKYREQIEKLEKNISVLDTILKQSSFTKASIILEDNVILDPKTPPLKTFFIDRIIGEMKKNDVQQVEDGKIKNHEVIDCVINDNGDKIREIIIKNYRQKERIDEIINTATWSLTRMIENSA